MSIRGSNISNTEVLTKPWYYIPNPNTEPWYWNIVNTECIVAVNTVKCKVETVCLQNENCVSWVKMFLCHAY